MSKTTELLLPASPAEADAFTRFRLTLTAREASVLRHMLREMRAKARTAEEETVLDRMLQESEQQLQPQHLPSDWLDRIATDSERVRAYLAEHGLEDAVRKTIEMAVATLPAGSTWTLALEGDGESDDEWLVLQLTLNANWTDAYDIFDRFVDEWIDATPPAARDRIRLNYTAR